MKYSILSVLTAWIFPTRKDRNKFRNFCKSIDNRAKIKKAQMSYPRLIEKIRNNKNAKIKVLFLVNENSKWKTQSLYEYFAKSDRYEPVIALTIADAQRKLPFEEKLKCLEDNYNFFTGKGVNCVYAWNTKTNRAINLKVFKPQIVFYQQPWYLPKTQMPDVVSKFALTCYVPYFLPNYGIMNMDYFDFHKFLFRNYVLNKDWENLYKEYAGEEYGDNIRAAGHTALDYMYLNRGLEYKPEYVIYAPHWSVSCQGNENDENYGTFLWNYNFMLDYARNHPEIKWVFKPHPTLKQALLRTGLFKENDIENYYREWEKIAAVCYSSEYTEIFMKSKLLITDCGSFLVEYFCTGKPVVHLISDRCNIVPPLPSRRIFDTFYKVRNASEFYNSLDTLLRRDYDYKKTDRLKVLNELNLGNCYAAKNIYEDLESVIKGEENAK